MWTVKFLAFFAHEQNFEHKNPMEVFQYIRK